MTGTQLPLFVDPDRSLAQRRVGWHLSTAAKSFSALHPSLEVTAAKSEGALTHRWEPLVRFTYDYSDNTVTAHWEEAIYERLVLTSTPSSASSRNASPNPTPTDDSAG